MKAINDAFSLYRVGHPGDRSRGRQEVSQVDRMSSPSTFIGTPFLCVYFTIEIYNCESQLRSKMVQVIVNKFYKWTTGTQNNLVRRYTICGNGNYKSC